MLGCLAQDGGHSHLHTSREGDVLRTVKINDILVSDCRTKVIPSCSSSDIVVNEILNSNPSTFVVARQVPDCISQYTHITWKVIVYTATVQLIHHLYRWKYNTRFITIEHHTPGEPYGWTARRHCCRIDVIVGSGGGVGSVTGDIGTEVPERTYPRSEPGRGRFVGTYPITIYFNSENVCMAVLFCSIFILILKQFAWPFYLWRYVSSPLLD